MFIAIVLVLLIAAVKCDYLSVSANFTSTIEETLNPSSVNPHDPVCQVKGYLSQRSLQNYSACLKRVSTTYGLGLFEYIVPTTQNVDFVVTLNCTEKNCYTSSNDLQYCQFVSSCNSVFGMPTADMGVEISQSPQNLRFVRNKTVTLPISLPHYTVYFDLTWRLAPQFAECESKTKSAVNCDYNFCTQRALMQNCIISSDRCAEFDALMVQFDSTCPGKTCICTPDFGKTNISTCQPYASTSCRDQTPSEYCATLDCTACRSDNATCKWCNRGGDRACAAVYKQCPSLHAGGDDTIQCGSEPPATPAPSDPTDMLCAPFDCYDCRPYTCKFCTSNGDWRCVGINGTCPSGVFEPPGKQGTCELKCINNCAGHGTCERERVKSVIGRPQCTCDPVDGWESDAVAGCRPWANRTACTEKVLNATETCKSEGYKRSNKNVPICANAQITIDCMARADALSCTGGQNTMMQVCHNNSVVVIRSAVAGNIVNDFVPCNCTDVDAGYEAFCRARACTQTHSNTGGAVSFCQCVREHIACLNGHFRSIQTQCNASDLILGSYAAICPELCKVLPYYTAAPLPPPPTPAVVNAAHALGVALTTIVLLLISSFMN
jgi:hypothetical protein